jgi:hypothetical protein
MIDGFMTFSRFAAGALLCACASAVAFAQKPSKADQKAEAATSQAQQQEYATVVRLADTAMSGQPTPSDFPIQFQNDFLRAQGGRVWVPITLTIDPAKLPSAAMTLYTRVAPRGMTPPPPPAAPDKNDKSKNDKNKKNDKNAPAAAPIYPYDGIVVLDLKAAAPGQPVRIVRGFDVPPGNYDLYVVLHERVAAGAVAKAAVLKQPLDVPNYGNGEFATSSVILADRVDQLPAPLPPDQQTEHPYVLGTSEIVVSPDHKFKKGQELIVLVQIYNPEFDKVSKKFSLEANFSFYRQDTGGEKFFNKTDAQPLTPETMGGGFDPSGSAAIQAGQAIPLQSFPEGNYRLEIKITDKLNAKALTQSVNFTVTP